MQVRISSSDKPLVLLEVDIDELNLDDIQPVVDKYGGRDDD